MMTSLYALLVLGLCLASGSKAQQDIRVRMLEARLTGKARADNLAQLASSLGESELVTLVNKAGLASALAGQGPMTLFGPINSAFEHLSPNLRNLLTTNTTVLKQVLLYHVIGNQVMSGSITDNQMVTSLAGDMIRLNVYKNGSIVTASGRPVVKADQTASNGVLHEVSGVMFPPFGTVANIVSKVTMFTTLLKAVTTAGLVDTLNGEGPFTLFAPTDEAFKKLPPGALDNLLKNTTALKEVLENHVIAACDYSSAFSNGEMVQTMAGHKIHVRIGPQGVFIDRAKVFQADVTATNGVVHVIEEVLLPHPHPPHH